jgi:hypothetical protein
MQMAWDSKAQGVIAVQILVIPSGNCFRISGMLREITVSLLLLSVV